MGERRGRESERERERQSLFGPHLGSPSLVLSLKVPNMQIWIDLSDLAEFAAAVQKLDRTSATNADGVGWYSTSQGCGRTQVFDSGVNSTFSRALS